MASGVITNPKAYEDWTQSNPLRKWMRDNHVSIMDAAARMEVSISIIQLWSKGVHVPDEESMIKISALMDVDPKTVRRLWRVWMSKRPGAA